MDLTILEGGRILDPEDVGQQDLAIAAGRIVGCGSLSAVGRAKTLDVAGCTVVPGFVDGHAHIIGGGGGMGPASCAPEIGIDAFLRQGITTVIGTLGFDTLNRTLGTLLIKAKALEVEGMSAYCFTGGFGYPPPSLLGSIEQDMAFIDRFVGVKMAFGEPASGRIFAENFSGFVAAAQRGGLLGGKSGVSHVHLGNTQDSLDLLTDAVRWGVPPMAMVPTHVNRNGAILEAAVKFAALGGTIDVTAQEPLYYTDSIPAGTAVRRLLDSGVPANRISVSSDGGSPSGRLREGQAQTVVPVVGIAVIAEMVEAGVDLGIALASMTRTPARKLRLRNKGRLRVGYDADIVVLRPDLTIRHVIARGKIAMLDGEMKIHGTFNPDSV